MTGKLSGMLDRGFRAGQLQLVLAAALVGSFLGGVAILLSPGLGIAALALTLGTLLLCIFLRWPFFGAVVLLAVSPIADQLGDIILYETNFFKITPQVLVKGGFLPFLLIEVWLRHRQVFREKVNWLLFSFMAYLALNTLLADQVLNSGYLLVRMVFSLLLIPFFACLIYADPKRVKVLWTVLSLNILTYFVSIAFLTPYGRIGGTYHVGERLGYFAGPQGAAPPLVFALVSALTLPYLTRSRRWVGLGCMLLTLLAVLGAYMTYLRTAQIAIGAVFLSLLFLPLVYNMRLPGVRRLAYALLLGLVVFVVVQEVGDPTTALAKRWSDIGGAGAGSGRLIIYEGFLREFVRQDLAQQLFGWQNGLAYPPQVGLRVVGSFTGTNNDLFDGLIGIGLVGLVLYGLIVGCLVKRCSSILGEHSIYGLAGGMALFAFFPIAFFTGMLYYVNSFTYFSVFMGAVLAEHAKLEEHKRRAATAPFVARAHPAVPIPAGT